MGHGGIAMAIPKRVPFITQEEYLRRERAAEFRSEYFNGEIFAMAGGSPPHSLISANTIRELGNRLSNSPCSVYDCNLRIRVSASGLYTYPDSSVICGQLEFDDEQGDTVLNPTLLVEVLSETTEAYDRGKKWAHYQRIPSLREYLLISQDGPRIERFLRNPDDTWTLATVVGVDQSLHLPSIDVTISLAEIFHRVDFAADSASPPEPRA
jgi:Uma2 family endonuclease